MGRIIAAVIVGYLVMAVVVMLAFLGFYLLLGEDGAFRENSYEPSRSWLAQSLVVSLLAAVVGGWVCAAIGRSDNAVYGLLALVVVLGMVSAVPSFLGEPVDHGPRDGSVGDFAVLQYAQPPQWTYLANMGLALVGVTVGARLRKPTPKT